MTAFLIKNAQIVDSGRLFHSDLLIKDSRIEKIAPSISNLKYACTEINAEEKILLPGVIDVHVHFREPGLTHKADIRTESMAAVAGGITSYIEMPNTEPKTTTKELLTQKFELASRSSFANYSFYLGATNDNFDELSSALEAGSPGVKIFMGASTGNMLVDNYQTLEHIFRNFAGIVVVHAESEAIIKERTQYYKELHGDHIPYGLHPSIRTAEACFESSKIAAELAHKYNTRLHIAHLSTEEEIELLNNALPKGKQITSEVCVHHLYFDDKDYEEQRGLIKCNPAIKEERHKKALLKALLEDKIDLIATDHAPHTLLEKQKPYLQCPSGIPLIQHSLALMLEFVHEKKMSLEKLVEKMSHNPAIAFNIAERGFIKEGFKADCVLIDMDKNVTVNESNLLSKCRWSPFTGKTFHSEITHTFVNGNLVWSGGKASSVTCGEKLIFQ